MTDLDLDFVRGQFPAFSEPSLEGFAHFENAGGSYACRQTIDWLDRYYRQTKVQPYYDFPASRTAGEQMDAAKTAHGGLAECRRRTNCTSGRPHRRTATSSRRPCGRS